MGPLFQWGLIPGPDLGGGTPAELALLRDDGSPTPLFTELGAFAARGGTGAAPTGLAPVAAHQYIWEGNWDQQHLGADTYRTTSEVDARFRLRFEGTGVIARARLSREAGAVEVTIDGQPVDVSLASFQADDVDIPLARRLPDGVARGRHASHRARPADRRRTRRRARRADAVADPAAARVRRRCCSFSAYSTARC